MHHGAIIASRFGTALLICLSLLFASMPSYCEQNVDLESVIPSHRQLFELPEFINTIIDERIAPLRNKEARLKALLDLVYRADALNLQYSNDITRTPIEAIASRQGNCVSLSFTFAAMARRAGLKVYFMESMDPGRWKQIGENYALERHMSLYLPIRNKKTKGYHVDFQYAEPDQLRHKRMSDARAIADYYSNRAIENLVDNNSALALSYSIKAIEADRSYDASWLNYGLIQRRSGNLDEAIRAYNTALKLNPRNLSVYNNLVVVYQQLGDHKKEQQLLKKVKRHREKNPLYLFSLGESAVIKKKYNEAIELFTRAIKLDKRIPGFYLALGEAYYLVNDIESALKVLDRGLDEAKDPDIKARMFHTIEFLQQEQSSARRE